MDKMKIHLIQIKINELLLSVMNITMIRES